MQKINLVIEMGSSNTVIYKVGSGIVLKEPTLIAVKTDKLVAVEIGERAKKMVGKTDDTMKIICPISHGIIYNAPVCELMLKGFLRKVLPEKTVNIQLNIVFIVTNGITEAELLLFKNIAFACGVSKVDFINVCLASLVGANVIIDKPRATVCVNLGGGTCDFAVVSLSDIISGFSISFGGYDMDKAIKDYVYNALDLEISILTAEKLKNECGSLYLQDTTNIEINGIDTMSGKPKAVIISALDIRTAIEPFFDKIYQATEYLIKGCSPAVVTDIANNGIYIVGGIANIVGLENYMSKKLNMQVVIPEQPENCAILGGSYQFELIKKR